MPPPSPTAQQAPVVKTQTNVARGNATQYAVAKTPPSAKT